MSLPDFDDLKEMSFKELNDLFWKEAKEVIDGVEDDAQRTRLAAFTWNMLERQVREVIDCPFDQNSSDPEELRKFHAHMMAYNAKLIANKTGDLAQEFNHLTDKAKVLNGYTVQLEAKIDAIIKELE